MADDYRFTGSKEGAALEASVSSVAEPAYRFEGRVQAPSLDVEDAPSGDIYVFDGEVRHDDLSVVSSDVSSEAYEFNVEFVRKSLAVSGAEGCGDVYEFTLDFGCSGRPVDLSGYYRKSEVDDLLSKKASRASTLRGYGIKDVYIEGTTIHIGEESVSVGGGGGSPVLYPFEIVEYASGKYAVKVADKFLFGDSLVSIDGFFSTGFLSVRGLDDTTGSGSGGTDLPAVWESLTKNEMPYLDVTINTAHIPVLPQSKVDGLAGSLAALKALIGGKADSSQLADYVLKSTYDTGMSGKLDKSVFDKLFTVHYKEGSATEIESLELNYGTWTTGFLSVRGLDDTTGSGSGGTDLPAVWESLTKNEMPYLDVTINTAHIPVLPQSKVTGLPDALSSLRSSYAGISALIPQAATADNQLADKEFVNSSIATATATFRGTFATLAALEATPADRNDYAFWAHKDEAGNTCYDKYTYSDSAWKFEYRLNNSSFTAAQWGAINSGITGALVTRLSGISDWALAASKPSYTTAEVTEKTNLYFTDARAKSALSGHTSDTTVHITAAERKAWNAKWDWNEAAVKAVKVNAAGSADKLASISKLWGNAFNGTADVNGDITLGSGKRIYFGLTSYYIELVNGNIHTNVGLYSDKFISARGVDPDAGGGGGASLPVVWASLQGNTDDYKDKTIHQAHIPTLPVSRIDGLATALAGKQPLITADSKLDYSLLKNTPTSLPANGGNADTVDGLHASSFAQWRNCDNVDTAYDFGFWRMFSTGSGAPTGKNASQFITVPYRKTTGNTTPDFAWQILAPNGDDPTHPEDFYVRTGLSKTWNPWRKLYHEGNSNNISTVWNAKRLVTPHNLICPYVFDSNTTVTGTLVLSLPYGFNSMMQSLELTVYDYSTTAGKGGATKFFINGYNFANGASSQWIIPTAFQIGILNANVRVGYYKNKCCILIGATNTIWHYPKLSVDKVHGTHSISVDSYGYNDWSCTFLQDESEISKIVTAFDAPLYAPCYTRAGLPYVTDNDVAAKYLKLSGGTMARDAAISWGVNDRTDWDTYVSGIRVMSSITANSGAPVRYATGISVMARYSFQIAAQGGDVDAFFIRAGNRDWKKLLHEGNYSSFALPLTGGTIKGSIRMDAPGTMPFIVRNYHLASGAGGGWARSIVECRVDDKNAFSISPFGNYTPGAANNKISYVSLGFADYGGLNLRISETDIKWGNDAIYHAGNFIDGTNYISPKTTLEGYGIEDWVLKYSADSPDTFKTSGIYRVSTTGTTGNGYWFNYGNVLVLRGTNTSDTIAQLAASYANSNLYYRSGTVSNFTDADHPWRLIYNSGNSNLPTVPWNCSSLTATNDVTAKSGLYGQYLEFSNIGSSANHGGFIDFHFKGDTEDYTSRIIEDANGQLTLYAKTIRIGKSNNANLLFLRPSYNYIWTDVAGGTLVLGTADGGQTSFANSAIFIKGKKVYIGGTETGNNALNVLGVAHATTGIYTDGYISARKQDTSSDIRLKTDFRPLDGALEYIRGTHFTRFRWRDGSGESVGIIAQEEQSREYGFLVRSHGEIGHLTYDYAASTALLGAALQEEDDKVEALKRRVEELENELDRLKQSNYANR